MRSRNTGGGLELPVVMLDILRIDVVKKTRPNELEKLIYLRTLG
jgi:hypothetical protein